MDLSLLSRRVISWFILFTYYLVKSILATASEILAFIGDKSLLTLLICALNLFSISVNLSSTLGITSRLFSKSLSFSHTSLISSRVYYSSEFFMTLVSMFSLAIFTIGIIFSLMIARILVSSLYNSFLY